MKHEHPVEGGSNPCPHCPPIPTQASMDKPIAVGFGCAQLTKNGAVILDGERILHQGQEPPTFQDAENMASLDPDQDWQVVLHGPLHGETYQRQGQEQWVCIERNDGFA